MGNDCGRQRVCGHMCEKHPQHQQNILFAAPQPRNTTTYRRPTLCSSNCPSGSNVMRAVRRDSLQASGSSHKSKSTCPLVLLRRPISTAGLSNRYWWLRPSSTPRALKGREGPAAWGVDEGRASGGRVMASRARAVIADAICV